jgi:hypothetical protein
MESVCYDSTPVCSLSRRRMFLLSWIQIRNSNAGINPGYHDCIPDLIVKGPCIGSLFRTRLYWSGHSTSFSELEQLEHDESMVVNESPWILGILSDP